MNTSKPHEHLTASYIWSAILAYIKIPNRMTWTLLQPSKALSFDGTTLTVEVSADAMTFTNNPKMLEHLSRVASSMGIDGVQIALKQAPEPPQDPSYYLVTDACTGEHLGFPSISLIEAHLKLASIGPEWPAVALLAHRMSDRGNAALWLPGERGPVSFEWKAVKLLQVGKE